jgi:LmbE family N-acetylglucosaminyl deacetylase
MIFPGIKRALVVAAHPDDETLGCGATMARLARADVEVGVLILGEGLSSRDGDVPESAFAVLREACLDACSILGATAPVMLRFPDNRFDAVPLLDLVKAVEAEIARFSPGIILTHHGGDLNIDHALTHRAVLTATRPLADRLVPEIWAFETPSATEWAFDPSRPFTPNIFVDISATLKAKTAAMARYDTEARTPPHPRAVECLTALATARGSTAGCHAAEAFQLARRIVPDMPR